MRAIPQPMIARGNNAMRQAPCYTFVALMRRASGTPKAHHSENCVPKMGQMSKNKGFPTQIEVISLFHIVQMTLLVVFM
jgi:hypothetical protein